MEADCNPKAKKKLEVAVEPQLVDRETQHGPLTSNFDLPARRLLT